MQRAQRTSNPAGLGFLYVRAARQILQPKILSFCGAGNYVHAHVRAERFGNRDRSVRALIIFHQGDPCAAHGEAGAVQRVHEFAFLPPCGLKRMPERRA